MYTNKILCTQNTMHRQTEECYNITFFSFIWINATFSFTKFCKMIFSRNLIVINLSNFIILIILMLKWIFKNKMYCSKMNITLCFIKLIILFLHVILLFSIFKILFRTCRQKWKIIKRCFSPWTRQVVS